MEDRPRLIPVGGDHRDCRHLAGGQIGRIIAHAGQIDGDRRQDPGLAARRPTINAASLKGAKAMRSVQSWAR